LPLASIEHLRPAGGMRFFFYGTLMDADVLAAVVGRRIGSARFQDAILDGFRRVYRRGASYPILLDDPDGQVDGVVVSALTAADAVRLDAFEGSEYRRAARTVAVAGKGTAEVQVYLTNPGVPASKQPWDFEGWRRHRAAYLRRVRRSGSPRS